MIDYLQDPTTGELYQVEYPDDHWEAHSGDVPVDTNGQPYPGSDPTNPANNPPPPPAPAPTPSGAQGTATFTQQHTDPDAAGYSPYSDPNWADVEAQLKADAASRGLTYDPSDLADVQRSYYNTGPTGGQGGNLQSAIGVATDKYDSRLLYDGVSVGDRDYLSGTGPVGSIGNWRTSPTTTSWFSQNAPTSGTTGTGGTSATGFPADIYPAQFGETYTTPERPDYLQGAYTPTTWDESYQPLSVEEMMADPGYQNRWLLQQQALERSAAAKGSILSGGTLQALNRYAQDYAANEYAAADARKFRNYQQRYGQFVDYNNLGFQARGFNEGAYQSDVANAANQYGTRFNTYRDALDRRRQAEGDYWDRNQQLVDNSLRAAALARP